MRRVLAACITAFALLAFGCAGMRSTEPPITKKTVVRCPKCGYPFEVEEGMRRMETTR